MIFERWYTVIGLLLQKVFQYLQKESGSWRIRGELCYKAQAFCFLALFLMCIAIQSKLITWRTQTESYNDNQHFSFCFLLFDSVIKATMLGQLFEFFLKSGTYSVSHFYWTAKILGRKYTNTSCPAVLGQKHRYTYTYTYTSLYNRLPSVSICQIQPQGFGLPEVVLEHLPKDSLLWDWTPNYVVWKQIYCHTTTANGGTV